MTDQTLLLLASLVLICSVVVPRVFPHWALWLKAVWRIGVFAVLSLLVQRLLGSPLVPQFHEVSPERHLWEQGIQACWWIVAARSAIGLARLFVVLENRPRETRIISDLIAGVVYLGATLAIVNFVFGVPIAGVLATSGVIAIVLGLALQSTLADVFSGIAVGIERPYKPGDLVSVEGGIEGIVTQVNWRSTHIETGNNDVAIVPNSVIAKARLVNHSMPSTMRGASVEIRLDARARPDICMATLSAAAKACLLPMPSPSVSRTGLQGDGAVYSINFSVASTMDLFGARTEMFAQVQHHLRHAGIALAVTGVAEVPVVHAPSAAELLAESDLFGLMTPGERDLLAVHLSKVDVAVGELVIREGDAPSALFIIAVGTVDISTTQLKHVHRLHRMGPGGSIGSIGMITGTPYAASARALTPVTAYRLSQSAIADAIAARPELEKGLEALARRGEAAISLELSAHKEEQLKIEEVFLTRVRAFLGRLAGRATMTE